MAEQTIKHEILFNEEEEARIKAGLRANLLNPVGGRPRDERPRVNINHPQDGDEVIETDYTNFDNPAVVKRLEGLRMLWQVPEIAVVNGTPKIVRGLLGRPKMVRESIGAWVARTHIATCWIVGEHAVSDGELKRRYNNAVERESAEQSEAARFLVR